MAYYKTKDGRTFTKPRAGAIKVDKPQKATPSNTLKYYGSNQKGKYSDTTMRNTIGERNKATRISIESNTSSSKGMKSKNTTIAGTSSMVGIGQDGLNIVKNFMNTQPTTSKSMFSKTKDFILKTFPPYNAYTSFKKIIDPTTRTETENKIIDTTTNIGKNLYPFKIWNDVPNPIKDYFKGDNDNIFSTANHTREIIIKEIYDKDTSTGGVIETIEGPDSFDWKDGLTIGAVAVGVILLIGAMNK